jgi:hypothetical protein
VYSRRYSLILVSNAGFPDGTFNHEALSIKTEDECKKSCLQKWQSCQALSWLGSRMADEPCVHYQTLRSLRVHPLSGCHYWKMVHSNHSISENLATPFAVRAHVSQPQQRSLLVQYKMT